MRPSLVSRTLLVHLVLCLAASGAVYACMGTPVPPPPDCPRTVFLAAFCPKSVVVPRNRRIRVPVGVMPFVRWNTSDPRCAKPISAILRVTLICQPLNGGSPRTFGPQTFTLATPVGPGPQPTAPVAFMIPAGAIPFSNLPLICRVDLVYTVTFGPGGGTGPLSVSGSTEVCLVQGAPGRPDVPRLEVCALTDTDSENTKFQACSVPRVAPRGEQAALYFLISNNDPFRSVRLNLLSEGRGVSVLPDGFTPANAYAAGVYAISRAVTGTDTFGARFTDDLDPFELVPPGDPMAVDPQRLTRSLTIGPLKCVVVSITMRSYGMCADGSCNQRFLKITGTFSDGTPALGCAANALVVGRQTLEGTAPPQSRLCEFTDEIRTDRNSITIWRPAIYGAAGGPLPDSETFAVGNLPPGEPAGFQLVGADRAAPGEGLPTLAKDTVSLETPPSTVFYQVDGYLEGAVGSPRVHNNVLINGLDAIPNGGSSRVPIIKRSPLQETDFDIVYSVGGDTLTVVDHGTGEVLYPTAGIGPTLQEFLMSPPAGLRAEIGSSRSYSKRTTLGAQVIATDRVEVCRSISQAQISRVSDRVRVSTAIPGAMWQASIIGKGAVLAQSSGPTSAPIVIRYRRAGTRRFPEHNFATLVIRVPGAINGPLRIPVLLTYR